MSKPKKTKTPTVEAVLRDFLRTIHATGGVIDLGANYAPAGDPEWIDLGAVYIDACKVLGVKPMISQHDND
jgi:hypothetical protein